MNIRNIYDTFVKIHIVNILSMFTRFEFTKTSTQFNFVISFVNRFDVYFPAEYYKVYQ